MQVIENEQIYCFDVDDTLILWDDKFKVPAPDRAAIIDPYSFTGDVVHVKRHERHIKLVQQMHGRGRHIIVWSQGGAAWARAVVDALGLTPFVHTVMTKPQGYVDDLEVTEWLKNRIYLPHDQVTEEEAPT